MGWMTHLTLNTTVIHGIRNLPNILTNMVKTKQLYTQRGIFVS